MSSKKHGRTPTHKPYNGPWPEQHPSIPGRADRTAKTSGGHPAVTHAEAHVTPVHKIPQQTPK